MAISRKGRLTCVHGQNTRPRRLTVQTPAGGCSPPRNPPRQKREQSYVLCGGTRASRPTDGFAVNRIPLSLRGDSRDPPQQKRNATHPRRPNTRPRRLTAERSSAAETARYVHAPAKCPHGLRAAPAHAPVGAPCRFTATVLSGGIRR